MHSFLPYLKFQKAVCLIVFLSISAASNSAPKIGLALSGGGSKGFAHVPILKALDSLNIPVDYIAGTSFGAIAGAMYALGYPGKEIEQMALDTDWYEVQNDEPERRFLPYFRKKDTGKFQLEFGLDGVKPVTPTGFIYGQKIILDEKPQRTIVVKGEIRLLNIKKIRNQNGLIINGIA